MGFHDPAVDQIREAMERTDAARVRLADAIAHPPLHRPRGGTMTDQATDYLRLSDAARQARDHLVREQNQRAAAEQADYNEKAPRRAAEAALEVLGPEFTNRSTWVAEGEPPEYGYAYSATAEIDGLRFLATTRQVDYGWDESLYLLVPCPNNSHPPADRRVPVHSLTGLAEILDALDSRGDRPALGTCFTCQWQREEQADVEPVPPPPPNATERLVEALETIIEDRIGQRLDGFLSTYLPDRI